MSKRPRRKTHPHFLHHDLPGSKKTQQELIFNSLTFMNAFADTLKQRATFGRVSVYQEKVFFWGELGLPLCFTAWMLSDGLIAGV